MHTLRDLIEEARTSLDEDGLPVGTVHTWTDGNDYVKTRNGWEPVPSKGGKHHAPAPVDAKKPAAPSAKMAEPEPKKPDRKIDFAPKVKEYDPSKPYKIDPAKDSNGDGVADAARVGVPADLVIPPPPIPRLPNLTDDERAIEEEFATDFEKNTEKMADDFLKIAEGQDWVFETDGAKVLNTDWTRPELPPDEPGKPLNPERAEARAIYNTALHQTANAIAKKAFLKRLDEIAKLPEDQRKILVTSGGVAAGKGSALAADPTLAQGAAATWDAAGEQNATENPWILEEAIRRGIKPTFLYVHNDPEKTWPGAIARAKKIGRMVDARVFADSYVMGAKNFDAFHKKYKDKVSFVIASGKPPQFLDSVPEHSLNKSADEIYEKCLQYVDANKSEIPEHIYRGATAGRRIWGGKKE